ncbi:MAG: T9SS type A sorting domain-containing protein [Bacteroidales bacterium]|nr:T9SS type A sorting domain-containing protein [Bacteroidales bacterium]
MRKFLSLIFVLMLCFNVKAQSFATATEDDSDVCTIVIEMFDSYGDGWGSDLLLYSLNGSEDEILEFTEEESSKTHTLEVSKGSHLVIKFFGSNMYGENSIKISYQDGDVLYEASSEEGSPNYLHPDNWKDAVFVDTTVDCGGENEGGDDNTGNEGDDDNTGNEEGDDNEEPVKPEIPNVVATTTETTVTLTWNAIEGATGYNIYTPNSFSYNVYGVTETTYTFEGLTAGTEYCFEVSAVYPTDESDVFEVCATTKASGEDEGGDDNTGNEGDDNTGNEGGDDNTGNEGGDDNTGNEEGDDNEEPVKPEIPNVVATTTETTITLTWDAIEGATSYNIYTPSGFDSHVLGLEDTTYTFEGLTAGKEYCFEVSAVYPTDESDAVEVCATTKTEGEDDGEDPEYPEQTTVPAAPVINVYAENSGLIVIEWEAVETAMFYYVYHKGKLVGDGQVLGTEVEILVNPETEYCFTVTAVNTIGESEHSNEACATTPAEGEDPENPDSNIEVAENDFVIYPNPVNDRLYIETQTLTQTIEIYDVYGRIQNLSNSATQQLSNSINVDNLNSGVYFVKVVTENGEVVKRFVKK